MFVISRGVQPYSRSKHSEEKIKMRFLHADSCKTAQYLPELQGNELSRYYIASERTSYLKYCDEIASTRPIKMFTGKRIVLRRLLTRKFRLQASFTGDTMITTDNVLNMVPKIEGTSVEFPLGILNSKLISWIYINTSMIAQKDDFPQVHISALSSLPLPKYDDNDSLNMTQMVNKMIALHKQKSLAKTPSDNEIIQLEIDATDYQINRLVYELYGLTEEEIQIVEGE